ncbi:MAG: hypothetical protein Q9160_002322 [Pyrenula sp. 1 TL-2023]
MPLPEFLSGRYGQYKEDTSIFTTWLHRAAETCGYRHPTVGKQTSSAAKASSDPVVNVPSKRLKGKERELAKLAGENASKQPPKITEPVVKTVKYRLTTSELLKQANAIAESTSKQVNMPNGIHSILKRAISARQRCAQWYASVGVPNRSDQGHLYFIDTMQTILELLSWKTSDTKADKTDSKPTSRQLKNLEQLGNIFEALEVENADEEYPLMAADISKTSKKSNGPQDVDVYELDNDDSEFEDAFALYCFFEDLHAIQEKIRVTWQSFKYGRITLEVATILTHAAIDIVRRLERDALARQKSTDLYRDSYSSLAIPVFFADALRQGQDPYEFLNTPLGLEVRAFDEFIYLPTARTLMKFAKVGPLLKEKAAWPVPVLQMRFSYISRPDLLEKPGMPTDQANHGLGKTSNALRESKSLHEFDDEFAKCARELWSRGRVSTNMVLASQLLLDILDICGSQDPPFYRALQDSGKTAENAIDFRIDAGGALDTGEVRWLTKDQQLLLDTYQIVKTHIPNQAFQTLKQLFLQNNPEGQSFSMDDAPPEVKAVIREQMIAKGLDPDDGPSEEHKRNAQNLNLKPIRPSYGLNFTMTHNPLCCGALALKLLTNVEEAGIALSNHHLSIFVTAHLYNALRQLDLTQIQSPEFERIVDLHKGAIFASDIPVTPEDMYRRMAYRTGLTGSQKRFNQKQAWKITTGVASASLRQLVESKQSIEFALLQLEDQVEAHTDVSKRTQSKKAQSTRRRQLTPLKFLDRLEEYLPSVLRDIQIDYITLTKSCNSLMRKIKGAIRQQLKLEYPTERHPGDTNDHGMIFMVLTTLQKNQHALSLAERQTSKKPAPYDHAELLIARDIFESHFNARAKMINAAV